MRVLSNTLEPQWARWDDPGDYPSGAGGGPMASYDYVECVEGFAEVEVEESDSEYGSLSEALDEHIEVQGVTVTKWRIEGDGKTLTVTVEEFDGEEITSDEM